VIKTPVLMPLASATLGKHFVLSKASLEEFLKQLSRNYTVYVPIKRNNERYYAKYPSASNEMVIGEVRSVDPLKTFFSKSREVVAKDFSDQTDAPDKPIAIFGAKACDLKGMKIQDFVFRNNGGSDPYYIRQREKNLIISSDCTCAIETCFCLALGVNPFPQEEFDLNLSPISESFIVEIGSEKGKAIMEKHHQLFQKANESLMKEREKKRRLVITEVEKNIQREKIPNQENFHGIIQRNYSSPIWEEEAKTCVECGACTIICPTCHCFLLYDQKSQDSMARMRVWDSCMLKGYARVAGGGNPRPRLWMRLRNRFEKKFDFFPKVNGIYACTGCGRCVSACPAKIDIRHVLKKLAGNA
jgi:heterodisulfide reductase subunit C